jgi:hypothetical protein
MGAPSNRIATLESQMIPMIQDVPGQTLSQLRVIWSVLPYLPHVRFGVPGKAEMIQKCRHFRF